ncbi:MAG: OmpA family protein [Pseudoflavonifractor sp.]|nr:OmpA family protein [Pseudoflavonifractor sp.]
MSARKFILQSLVVIASMTASSAYSQNIFSEIKGIFGGGDKEQTAPKSGKQADKLDAVSTSAVDDDIYDIDLDRNLHTPRVGNKQKEAVREYQYRVARQLANKKEQVELMRDKEVVVITIPSDNLFAPNDTVLSATAPNYLRPLVSYLRVPEFYKMILVMHSDDTGSEEYTDRLTEQRVSAVYDWLDDNGADVTMVVPYGQGADEPLFPNNSRTNREKNRRLEVYLVPGPEMIRKAKDGTLL